MGKVQGEVLDVDGFVEDGLVVYVFPASTARSNTDLHRFRRPIPFNVDIQPRFPEAAVLLAQECELIGH
jgi:hypothetical protein